MFVFPLSDFHISMATSNVLLIVNVHTTYITV